MARIRLVPVDELTPALRQMVKDSEAHLMNPATYQAGGLLPETFQAFWDFYGPLKFGGLLDVKLKELVRLKIARLNQCIT